MTPLPTTRIIPTGWSTHHAQAAQGFMTAECRIHDADQPGEWPDYTPTPGTTHYAGVCSVQALGDGQDAHILDTTSTTRAYMVSIPLPGPDMRAGENAPFVTITACPDDPNLVGRTMSVEDIQHGSTNWTRDLICIEHLTLNNPEGG